MILFCFKKQRYIIYGLINKQLIMSNVMIISTFPVEVRMGAKLSAALRMTLLASRLPRPCQFIFDSNYYMR